jgi:hypothetical protein
VRVASSQGFSSRWGSAQRVYPILKWRERADHEVIRRIVGGSFMLGGVVFGVAGVAIRAVSVVHAMH